MCAPLCDALTAREDGQETLERLEQENLFVVALDDERRWYRYHHLFADFLRGRLRHEDPGLARELHLRASGWHEDRGQHSEAIAHALFAPDHDLAARLIEEGVKGAWSRGEGPTVLRWVGALPDDAKRRRPRLILEHAQALALVGRLDESEPLLDEGESAAEDAEDKRRFLLGYAASIRSYNARLRGDAPRSIEYARKALSLMPEEELHLRNFAAVCLGDALRVTGDLAAAVEALAEAARIGRAAGHVYGTVTALVWWARLQNVRGELRASEATLRQALDFLAEQGAGSLPAAGLAYVGMGALLYERDELDGAERELSLGVERAELAREVSTLVWGYVTLSKAKLAREDRDGAAEMARESTRVARSAGTDLESALAANWMVRLNLARGNLAGAEAAGQERLASANPDEAGTEVATRIVDRLTSARLLHARGRYGEALQLLEELRETAEKSGRTGNLLEILALQALTLWAESKRERAVSAIARALVLAEPEGYVRTFVDEGPAVGDLLSATLEARRRGDVSRVPAKYLAKLSAAVSRGSVARRADSRLPDSLSEREMEVLALISAGSSNGEIAARLFVSTSTVKTHINNLYRKLEARSRTQAVARARDLDLL
jgi:LuxR family transcriptional regulator, maltose regulon positive regulatory protein